MDARWLLNIAFMAMGDWPDKVPPRWLIPPETFASTSDPGRFFNVAPELGLDTEGGAGGVVVDDLDGDADLDILASAMGMVEQLRYFRNDGGGRFTERTREAGLTGLVGGLNLVHADYHNDGDQDIYANLGGAFEGDTFANALFANPGHGNAWVTLKLEGRHANRSAIGARIQVTVIDPTGERNIHALVSTGGSFGSQSLQQEIGLGDAMAIRRVEIQWPGGERQVFDDLPMRRTWRLVEGESRPREIRLPGYDIPDASLPIKASRR